MTQWFQLLCLSHSGFVDSGHYITDNVQEVNYCINIPSSRIFRCYLNLQRQQCEEEANLFPGKIRRITRIKPGIMKKTVLEGMCLKNWDMSGWRSIIPPQNNPPLPITYHQTNTKTMQTLPSYNIHSILYGNEGASSQYSDTEHYVTDVIIRELLDSIFNKLPAFIHQLEIQTY